tara:strand:+ start:51 stop:1001 length:951 start_codon:yes stop_codon:yes gene_type:complete
MNVVNNRIDFFFVKFPILFPLIYGILIYLFPNYQNYIILITILILAEPHFAATWPFMINKNNRDMLIGKKIEFIFAPLIIFFISIFFFFSFKEEFLLFFFIANVYHVTRQSTGICKLYSANSKETNYHINLIYFYNIVLFFVGVFRFYVPIIKNEYILLTNIFLLGLLLLIILFKIVKFGKGENLFTLLTGLLIFYPIAFVDNPVHAIIMGVTMHYSQYIILTSVIVYRRQLPIEGIIKKNALKKYLIKFFLIIAIYSVFMTFFSSFEQSQNEILKQLILIPILFQLLHFYFDGLLWRFSFKENRLNTLQHIFKKT